MKQSSSVGLVVVMIVALIASAVVRDGGRQLRGEVGRKGPVGDGQGRESLSRMNSYALALLLGGLRGPLVMVLWSTSEQQKSDRQLEDFDTKVEWIRLLQPDFDSVHIFQVWNKAYNISVQMASLGNKYLTILDAIDYAKRVDRERPDNINVLTAIGQVYFDKLGNSTEKDYYRSRVMAETKFRVRVDGPRPGEPGYRVLAHEPLLDEQGNLLKEYLEPGVQLKWEPNDQTPESERVAYNGATFQFLEKFQPFKEGVSTFAIGYNYHKRAQLLQNQGNQTHTQLSDLVVDSRPALALKNWAEECWLGARRLEIASFNLPVPAERVEMEAPTAGLAPTAQPNQREKLEQAIWLLERAASVTERAFVEYDSHLRRFAMNAATYQSHLDGLRGLRFASLGDAAYAKLFVTTDEAERSRLKQIAYENYSQAASTYARIILRYYTDDPILDRILPPGVKRQDIPRLEEPLMPELLERSLLELQNMGPDFFDTMAEDRGEYLNYHIRCVTRLRMVQPGR